MQTICIVLNALYGVSAVQALSISAMQSSNAGCIELRTNMTPPGDEYAQSVHSSIIKATQMWRCCVTCTFSEPDFCFVFSCGQCIAVCAFPLLLYHVLMSVPCPNTLVQLHKHVAWCQASNTVQSPIKAAVASAFKTCSKTATRAHRQWCEHRKCNDACRKLFCFSEHIQHSAACKSSSMQG